MAPLASASNPPSGTVLGKRVAAVPAFLMIIAITGPRQRGTATDLAHSNSILLKTMVRLTKTRGGGGVATGEEEGRRPVFE
jgi:hypothetical protein